MSHADIFVCDCDQQQETGPSFSKYGRLKLCRSASNVPTSRSIDMHQLRPETGDGMDWMYHAVIDGALESLLRVTIYCA